MDTNKNGCTCHSAAIHKDILDAWILYRKKARLTVFFFVPSRALDRTDWTTTIPQDYCTVNAIWATLRLVLPHSSQFPRLLCWLDSCGKRRRTGVVAVPDYEAVTTSHHQSPPPLYIKITTGINTVNCNRYRTSNSPGPYYKRK